MHHTGDREAVVRPRAARAQHDADTSRHVSKVSLYTSDPDTGQGAPAFSQSILLFIVKSAHSFSSEELRAHSTTNCSQGTNIKRKIPDCP